jgi:hypothetical protein
MGAGFLSGPDINLPGVRVTTRGGRREGSGRKPGSRNKVGRDLKSKLHALADEKAVATLERLLNEKDPRVRMEAARELLNRVLGKPAETARIEHGLSGGTQDFLLRRAMAVLKPTSPALAPAPDRRGVVLLLEPETAPEPPRRARPAFIWRTATPGPTRTTGTTCRPRPRRWTRASAGGSTTTTPTG